jgi:hypothetical protein
MSDEHVVSALVRKYGEIKGKLIAAEKHSRKLRADLGHLDAVLKLFRTNYETAAIIATRPKRPIRWGKRGQGWRTAIDVLRRADSPMTAREIGLQVARKLGVETKGEPLRYLVTSIGDSLQRATKKGIARRIGDYPRRWEIVR